MDLPAQPVSALSDDAALVERARANDPAAFDELVERYKQRIYGTIYHMTSNHEDANDLAQETFIRAYKNLHRFKGDSSFYTWIYRIAVNTTINFLNGHRRRSKNHLSLDDVDARIQENPDFIERTRGEGPDGEVAANELMEHLNVALQKLSPDHRLVVTLYDIQGLSHAEIAKITNSSEGTVRSRLYYARLQLQQLLKRYLPEKN
ncbi:MAG: sigma-70 family RNA polymerase sigma factor [Verrucomicrobia bacterium]|nr:sigma-70 family RNA polymerase sigma factor [Verrucomicrobiota bacterium]